MRAGCSQIQWIMVQIFRPGHGAPRDKSHKENLIKMLHFHDNAEKVRILMTERFIVLKYFFQIPSNVELITLERLSVK